MKSAKKLIFPILLLALSTLVFGCQTQNSAESALPEAPAMQEETPVQESQVPAAELKTLFVGPEKVDCVGEAPMECLQVKESLEDAWQFFYNPIEGFEWEPGYTYELRVAVHPVQNPPAGGSSLRYELIEVVGKTETAVKPAKYIEIEQPAEGAVLDIGQPILVSGMGAGLFEGNVVVQIVDAEGNQLALQPTTIQSPDAGIGGEGPWQIELKVTVMAETLGKIVAFANSPADGSIIAQDEVSVTLQPDGEVELENTAWQLVSLADGSLDAPLMVHQVTATFVSENAQVAGSAGCNRYFGAYELDGDQLTIPGPLGTTRMMCPEPQMALESAYLAALEQVRRYEIDSNAQLNLFDTAGNSILIFQVDPYSTTLSFSHTELENATYPNDWAANGSVTLVDGQYSEANTADSAAGLWVILSNRVAFGDLDGDGREEAALILVTDMGGSGTFYSLVLLGRPGEALTSLAATQLGDRVQIKNIRIENSEIVVELLTASDTDPQCCPSEKVIRHFAMQNGNLVLVQTEPGE